MKKKTTTLNIRAIPKHNYDLIYIEWVDSRQANGWRHVDEIEVDELKVCSIGWKILETEEVVCISGHYGLPPNPQFCGDMTIPKCAIKEILTVLPK